MNRQQQAINDYLQALLNEVEDEPEEQQQTAVAEVQEPVVGLDRLVAEIPETIEEAKVEVELETEVVEQAQVVTQVPLETSAAPEQPVQPAASESALPDWAEQRFQCLLFKVSGLTLAVPLVRLNSVVPWTEKIVETPNQTDWYLGLVNHHGKNVKVIDTALMVLPENRRHAIAEDPSDRFSHILLVNDNNWGLACDEIGDVIWLTREQVKWRKNKAQRAWLAGTAIEQMCALMDTEVFADMLNRQIGEGKPVTEDG
jgi:purine-binding chemotaxis protein CheW